MPRPALISDPSLSSLLARIAAEYPGLYLAGGRIRDWLLGREGRDVDLCVARGAIRLARGIANATGGAFYILDDDTDAARILYQESGLVVDLASLRGGDIISDLKARDLTINAMAVRLADVALAEPRLIDPCHGRQDLEARVVRATSEEAFRHDPVRLLRAVRLEAVLRFRIEPQTEAWIRRDASLLPNSSPERIRYELLQILATAGVANHVLRLHTLGLLASALPEVALLAGSPSSPERGAASQLEWTLAVLTGIERLETQGNWLAEEEKVLGPFSVELARYLETAICDQRTRGLLLRWAALLQRIDDVDAAHSESQAHESGGNVSGDPAAEITERFHFSAQEVNLARSTVANAQGLLRLAAKGMWDRRDLYRYFQRAIAGPIEPLLLARASQPILPGKQRPNGESLSRLASEILGHYFLHPEELVTPPTIATGADVMEWLGVEQGPVVGAVLREIREEQAMGRVSTREQARKLIRARHARAD
ncbi:MAG: Poly(A) polymerase I precursor [Chloroflexi bacterium ADurb.Bin180]|nr:MAG: Poly(A) polymerase I precursor [Chloroflexi bacterium ADurb.Bin180]